MAKPSPVNVGASANDGNGDTLRSSMQTVNLAIADYTSLTETTTQDVASSVNFASGKGVEYDGVPIEAPDGGLTQVTFTPATSGTITLSTADDLAYRENNGDVNVNGLVSVASVSSPVGTYFALSPLPFSTGSSNSDASTASITWLDDSAGTYTVVPCQIGKSSNQLIVIMDVSLIEASDIFYISANFGKA